MDITLTLNDKLVDLILDRLEESKDKEWIKLQLDEQRKGGAWRKRLRDQGYVS